MADTTDCMTVIAGMTSSAESTRKLAAYHLQSLVSDVSFADAFVQADGMSVLRNAILEEHGNALAYSLGSFTGLLEADVGWEAMNPDIIERAVQLVIDRPSINVLRNALLLLVLVVSRPIDQTRSSQPAASRPDSPSSVQSFGLRAIMPLLQMHESFLECLIDKLGSADHALCANALNLINTLIRDSIINSAVDEWPQLIIKLHELGLIAAVERLMRSGALPDIVHPLLEFQGLTKVLLARWRSVSVDAEKYEHLAALRQLHVSSFRPKAPYSPSNDASQPDETEADSAPNKWRRLGFQSENPVRDFEDAGFLGLMDLSEFVRGNVDTFQNMLLDQSVLPMDQRCPIARASLSVTMLLYEYFDVERITQEDIGSRLPPEAQGDSLERYAEPLLLHWDRLHRATLAAFFKLWKEADAVTKDYHKIEDLTRLLIGRVFGNATRKDTAEHVEREVASVGLHEVRKWQLTELDEAYDYAWGADLVELRQQIREDSIEFLKEQRIRSLLQGSWFPIISVMPVHTPFPRSRSETAKPAVVTAWRFVRLSQDRRFLHHAAHPHKLERELPVQELPHMIDLDRISSVDSTVSRTPFPAGLEQQWMHKSSDALTEKNKPTPSSATITSLTIYGASESSPSHTGQEKVLLELSSDSISLASEWLDGLLMLLNQQPITSDTNKLVDILEDWSLKVRMFNLRWEDVDWDRAATGEPKDLPLKPEDRDYWYEMGG